MHLFCGRMLLPAMLAATLFAQEQPATTGLPGSPQVEDESYPAAAASVQPAEPPGGNRVFGVLPNYRTADASQEGTVLTNRQKLTIASKDSFDYPLVLTAAAFAGLGQLTNQQPSFGQGLKGYAHRLVTNYADQAMIAVLRQRQPHEVWLVEQPNDRDTLAVQTLHRDYADADSARYTAHGLTVTARHLVRRDVPVLASGEQR